MYSWLAKEKLVAKPDQLIKRRGKGGLLLLNANWANVHDWIKERAGSQVTIDGVSGTLRSFIVEPFVPHKQSDEYYICIQAERDYDEILFHHEGGIDIGDVDSKAKRLRIPISSTTSSASSSLLDQSSIVDSLLKSCPAERIPALVSFVQSLYKCFVDLHFSYLEINPLVVTGTSTIHILDLAAKIDQTAEFECSKWWGSSSPVPLDFPAPFGRDMTQEEQYIADLDSKTGASLKLTILNKDGRVWTMVAGGGASVAYR